MRALLSSRPRFVDAILSGDKRFEYRRNIFRRAVSVVLVYATAPVCRVVAEFRVGGVLCASPGDLWRKTRTAAGIDETSFFEYFVGRALGYAITIEDVKCYSRTFHPIDRFGVRPPQSFLYLPS